MARKRPAGSDDPSPYRPRPEGRPTLDALTRAEARALSRSAPLTPTEFKAMRRAAEQRVDPLPVLLEGAERTPDGPGARGSARA